jgi:hypothetical protein
MVTTRQTMFAIGPHKHCVSRDVRVQSSKWCGPGSVRHEVLRSSTKQLLNCEKGPGRLPAGPASWEHWPGVLQHDANSSRTFYQHGTKSAYSWCDSL